MKKFQIIIAVITAISLISVLVSSLVIGAMASELPSQNAVSRWVSDGTPTAQLSAFLTDEAGVTSMTMKRSMPQALDNALTEAAISPPNENARLYALGYSAESTASITFVNENGKTVGSPIRAAVTACGGDYFIFHPLTMLSGYYFNTEDLLNDCVVIDNDIAWQIFGSHDVVGRVIKLNGRDCYISGVTECGRDGKYSRFYGDMPRIFVSYSLCEELLGDIPVTAVEVLLPNPVGDFAMDMFKEVLSVSETEAEFIENSARFSDGYLGELLTSFAERSVRTNSVTYPYFENTARVLNDKAAVVYIFKIVPICIMVAAVALEIIILYANRRRIFKAVVNRCRRRKFK